MFNDDIILRNILMATEILIRRGMVWRGNKPASLKGFLVTNSYLSATDTTVTNTISDEIN